MNRTGIGLQLHTVRHELADDPVETLRAVAEMGYEGVEGGPPAGISNSEYLEILGDCGLTLVGGGTSPQQLREDLPGVVAKCRELGISSLMTGVGGEIRSRDGDWAGVVSDLGKACAAAAEAGLRICYHNHAFEFQTAVEGTHALDYLLSTIPSSAIQAELDTYWVKAGGEDPVEYIDRYSGRLPYLHIKDRAAFSGETDCPFAEIGQGTLDWDSIFEAASKAGVEWYLVEQDRCVRPALDSARMSIEYLRSRGMTGQ